MAWVESRRIIVGPSGATATGQEGSRQAGRQACAQEGRPLSLRPR